MVVSRRFAWHIQFTDTKPVSQGYSLSGHPAEGIYIPPHRFRAFCQGFCRLMHYKYTQAAWKDFAAVCRSPTFLCRSVHWKTPSLFRMIPAAAKTARYFCLFFISILPKYIVCAARRSSQEGDCGNPCTEPLHQRLISGMLHFIIQIISDRQPYCNHRLKQNNDLFLILCQNAVGVEKKKHEKPRLHEAGFLMP